MLLVRKLAYYLALKLSTIQQQGSFASAGLSCVESMVESHPFQFHAKTSLFLSRLLFKDMY